MTTETYGKSLPDQFDRIATLSDLQHDILEDIRDLYDERAVLEKEYGNKLEKLAEKARATQTKKLALLAVGSDPTKSWDDLTIGKCTLAQALSALVQAFADEASDSKVLAEAIKTQTIAKLKETFKQCSDLKSQHENLFTKLVGDRDKIYNDRIKMKQKYDDECGAIEDYRKKHESHVNDKHAGRMAKHLDQQHVITQNAKNTYLVSIEVANKSKHVFYERTLPALENHLQDLQSIVTRKIVSIIQLAHSIRMRHLESLQSRVETSISALSAHDPEADQALFIEYNIRPFTVPNDWTFEPCSTHYDTPEIVLDPQPKIQLQNMLSRARGKIQEINPSLEAKRMEVDKLSNLLPEYQSDASLGNADELADELFNGRRSLVTLEFTQAPYKAEEDMLHRLLGDDQGSQSPHNFKSSSFSIPTACAVCKTNIWGLSKQGKTCRSCHVSVHNKCELQIPANCGRSAPTESLRPASPSSLARTTSVSDRSITSPPEDEQRLVHAIYAYQATSDFELSVNDGDYLRVLEEDDGSGWVKVLDSNQQEGLVPASYVTTVGEGAAAPQSNTIVSSGATGEYVRGLYEYSGSGAGELDVVVGQLIQLTVGGRDFAEGWYEGVDASGKRGIFPSSYVEAV